MNYVVFQLLIWASLGTKRKAIEIWNGVMNRREKEELMYDSCWMTML